MSRRNAEPSAIGRPIWKHLEIIIARGHDRGRVFEDWLDLMLAAQLSLSDNMSRGNIEAIRLNKMDGEYEDRYMLIVRRYADDRPSGERAVDHFTAAFHELVTATEQHGDVLGDLFENCISFGEHGQFFTPVHLTEMIAQLMDPSDGEGVSDPACGSGRTLIAAGRQNPSLSLYGADLDPRCAKMTVLNFLMLGLHGQVTWGNTLSMEEYKTWAVTEDGFVYEHDAPKRSATGQAELFAA